MLDPLLDMVDPNNLRLVIPFTQYLRPDGRKRRIEMTVVGGVAEAADRILRHGWVFEVEELTTGDASLTVSDGEEDVATEVVPNGPEVPVAIERLVMAAASLIEGA